MYGGVGSHLELEPLGGVVPTHDPYYAGEDFNTPEYEWGGNVSRPEFGCTLPDIGVPAPCTVAAAYMNHLERVNENFSRSRKSTRPKRPPTLNPGPRPDSSLPDDFIGADNRSNQIRGLRVVGTILVDETEINVWAVDNSTAAQTQRTPLTTEQMKILRWNFELAVSDEKCAKFIEDVLNRANERYPHVGMWSDYINGMFDAVETQGGFSFGNTILNGIFKQEGSTTHGSFENDSAEVEFATYFSQVTQAGGQYNISQKAADALNRQRAITMAMTAIHEIMHLAGFNDTQLAYAVADVTKDKTFGERGIPERATTRKHIIDASNYWSNRLHEACNTTGTRRSWSAIRIMR